MSTLADDVETLLEPYLHVYGRARPTVSVHLSAADGTPMYEREPVTAHAPASLVKLPIALAVLPRVPLDREILVVNDFPSAVGGTFALDPRDDSDAPLYGRLGQPATVGDLVHRMLALSSNLAANLLIDLVSYADVSAAARDAGATATHVRRHLGDLAGAAAGVAGTTTARDAARLVRAAAAEPVLAAALGAQQFNAEIPAGLPPGTHVAHKTGWITGVVHDTAVVMPADRAPFVLAALTTGFVDAPTASMLIGRVAALCFWAGAGPHPEQLASEA